MGYFQQNTRYYFSMEITLVEQDIRFLNEISEKMSPISASRVLRIMFPELSIRQAYKIVKELS